MEKLAFWINVHNSLVMHVIFPHINFFIIFNICYKYLFPSNTVDQIATCFVLTGIFGLWNSEKQSEETVGITQGEGRAFLITYNKRSCNGCLH